MTRIILTILLVTMSSCVSSKNSRGTNLFNVTWELEFISGPRIAFSDLYPNKKPVITFNKTTKKAEGTNSCNGYSAEYTLEGDDISFGDPGPTTMMFCGNGENVFLNTIKKINKHAIDADGKLNLMIDDVIMMRFKIIE
ncbi:META domain-containing protein [Flavivirga abyssicola]|uniref:META domain-containing protein n=1 Tax=Flavivirga abyssicola TaxID=3063533 RepID=UPI0026DED198|nr:META domain-containing protein [Flavivirga sp. MEBiC07777]WVK12392.1 META domain-containing protein [Flavivirga sp. MEBiC07777]